MNYKSKLALLMSVLAGVLAGLVVFLVGIGLGTMQTRDSRAVSDEREARILAWIVERNPNATIRQFTGFPRALLEESGQANIDYRLVMALIDKESEFKADAIGRSGEIGLMQILPKTAELVALALHMSFDPPVRNKTGTGPSYSNLGTLGDPKLNVKIGVAYLKEQVAKFGTGPVALRSYNRGDANAQAHRPHDRYAEEIGLRLIKLVQEFPR